MSSNFSQSQPSVLQDYNYMVLLVGFLKIEKLALLSGSQANAPVEWHHPRNFGTQKIILWGSNLRLCTESKPSFVLCHW